ncbi:hypothetical protein Tco_0208966 [Tanacetum coccineum]
MGGADGGVAAVMVMMMMRVAAAAETSGGGEARGGEWVWGSNRSGDEECFWSWPEMPAGKVFRRRPVVAGGGGGRRWVVAG